MPYNLKLADSVTFTVEDDTISDRTILPLTIFGKSDTIDCGEALQNNLFYLLETYNSAELMLAPTPGMIWYDNSDNKLKLYTDASVWKQVLFESDTVERIQIINQKGNTQRSNTGEMLTATILYPKTSINTNKFDWYHNGILYASGVDVIVPISAGVYYATYNYSIGTNSVYLKSIDYKVSRARDTVELIRSITITSAQTPAINVELTAQLYDSVAAIREVHWQWTWNGEEDFSEINTQYASVYTPVRLGNYTVTAKYIDLNSYDTISVSADIIIN
jgi:hypothetical protein